MHIRPAAFLDLTSVRSLYLSAFPEEERQSVASLAVDLLAEKSVPETFSLVAEVDGMVVGHVSFSPIALTGADNFQGYILAPLAVRPQFQKQRIGTRLIEAGMQRLSGPDVDVVFVYGDPQYYGKFGFDANVAARYVPPYPLQYSFGWQAKPLTDISTFPSAGKLSCVPAMRDPQLW